jgi:ParB family chromosome partitioning protein
MYGVLQPLVVTRVEIPRDDGSFTSEYELISGERRLRASKLAGLAQVPVLIRSSADGDREKLEMAIIENLQREDLNVVDRAKAFKRLADEFGLKHADIGKKMGRSREYVSNSIRILALPEDIILALSEGKLSEGHTRPLLMLVDKPAEQKTMFLDILTRKMSVREAEMTARRIAYDRARKLDVNIDPELVAIQDKMKETLGTRVFIERTQKGGKISIDFFEIADLRTILELLEKGKNMPLPSRGVEDVANVAEVAAEAEKAIDAEPIDDRAPQEKKEDDDTEIYSIQNFSI